MSCIGSLLKSHRLSCKYSLKQVHEMCGITDSKLSRIERGEQLPDAFELHLLAELYKTNATSLFISAGYLSTGDISDYCMTFQNAHLLNDEERQSIQTQINLLTKGRKGDN